jgi:DNA-binding NarL/FixJ family response regulator
VLIGVADERLRSTLCRIVGRDRRFVVVAAVGTGEEAVAEGEPFDLALIDLAISGLGGGATMAGLSARTASPSVVILAGTGAVYLRHAAAAEGAAGFLVYPDDLDRLAERIADLRGSGSPGAVPAGSG